MDKIKIIDNLKNMLNCKTDFELAEKLGLNKRTISVWRQRNSVNLEKIIEYAVENNLDLNVLFKTKIFELLEEEPKIDLLEEFIVFYLKKIKKIDRKNIFNLLFYPSVELLTFCLKQKEIDIFFSKANAKNILISIIKDCKLNSLLHSNKKREELTNEIQENYSNLECYVILKYRDYFI